MSVMGLNGAVGDLFSINWFSGVRDFVVIFKASDDSVWSSGADSVEVSKRSRVRSFVGCMLMTIFEKNSVFLSEIRARERFHRV